MENRNESDGKQSAYISQAEHTRARVEPKGKYSKDIRQQIDNVSKRNKFKSDAFNGAKTIKDPYTNQTIHSSSEAAKAKYGSGNATKHTADVDHTVPLEKVYNKAKDNPFLSMEDIKEIANIDKNYKVVNSKTNRSKGSKTNSEYARKNSEDISKSQKNALKKEQFKTDISVNKEIVKKTMKNANKIGIESAKVGAKFGGGISAAQNLKKVVKREEDIGEAVIQVGIDTAKAGAASYGTGICTQIIEGAVEKVVIKTSSKQLAKGLSTFAESGGSAKAVVAVMEAGDSVIKYIKGDINSTELVLELGEKGTGLAASFIAGGEGAVLGAGAGAFIGGVIGSVLPGAGTLAGSAVGLKVGAITGEIVGNMVGYMIGTEVYRRVSEYMLESIVDSEELARLESMYNQAAEEIRKSRLALETSLKLVHMEHQRTIIQGFESMHDAILKNDISVVNTSLQTICNQFGRLEIVFTSRDEFDEFMLNPDTAVKLGS